MSAFEGETDIKTKLLTRDEGAADRGEYRKAAGASYSLKVCFFPALAFLAIRQMAGLQALPYPLHDFAGAFLAAAPSLDPADQHTGPLTIARQVAQGIASEHRPQCVLRGGGRDRIPRGLQARLRGDRVEAARLNLSPGPVAALAQGQKSECAGGKARGRGGLGAVKPEQNSLGVIIQTNGIPFCTLFCALCYRS
jgi:hypothetical protein